MDNAIFKKEIAKIFPVSVFMELMGMDITRLNEFRELAEAFFKGNNDPEEIQIVSAKILQVLGTLVADKRLNPDDRLLSHLVHVEIDGKKMSDDEVLAMSFVLFLGGMDTVTNVTGFAFQQLAQMPELQK